MEMPDYIRRDKKWRAYHRFEKNNKACFLRKISVDDGFRILKELYQFAYKLGNKTNFKKRDIEKIRTLAKTHSVFSKVKS